VYICSNIMPFRYIALAVAIVCLSGCRTIHPVSEEEIGEAVYYSRITSELAGEEIIVLTRDGIEHDARGLQLMVDSTSWFDPDGQLVMVATRDIGHVVRVDRDRGRAQGAGIGVLSGVAVGGVGLIATLGDDCCMSVYPAMIVGAGALVGALPGLIIGAMVGERKGAKTVYEITP
jgi:hypothetical protein